LEALDSQSMCVIEDVGVKMVGSRGETERKLDHL